jgi:hypothetical protein
MTWFCGGPGSLYRAWYWRHTLSFCTQVLELCLIIEIGTSISGFGPDATAQQY